MILITHDLGVVAETCDDVAVMYAGRIVERAQVGELFRRPRHPYTLGLMRAMPRAESTNPDHVAVDGGRRRLREIPGVVPALGSLPPGCSFAARCPRVEDDCRAAVPPLAPAGAGGGDDAGEAGGSSHDVRCLHPGPDRDPDPGSSR